MQKPLPTVMLMLSVISFLSSCGTVTPDLVDDKQGSYDATTPSGYNPNTSGFLYFLYDSEGRTTHGVITDGARSRYNNFVASYRLQMLDEHKVNLVEDSGVERYIDIKQNNVWRIDNQHLAYFMEMVQWKKDKRVEDSNWAKLKDILTH